MFISKEIIYLIAILLGFLIRLAIKKHKESSWLDEAQKRQQTRFEYLNKNIMHDGPEYPSRSGKWTASGWVFDEKTQMWQPPDYLAEESRIKWRWDEEKKIWIDADKEARMARYKEYHKDKPPTFEEWKAMKEQHKNDEHPGK